MPTITSRKTDFVTCKVKFSNQGVMLDFAPSQKGHTKQAYENIVAPLRHAAVQAGGGVAALPNGAFKRKDHKRSVSKSRSTRFAFCLNPNSTWRFTKSGFALKKTAGRARFSTTEISPNGKVVEVTFKPEKKTKEYAYELWLQADVIQQGVAAADRPSVTIIVDPVIRSDDVP